MADVVINGDVPSTQGVPANYLSMLPGSFNGGNGALWLIALFSLLRNRGLVDGDGHGKDTNCDQFIETLIKDAIENKIGSVEKVVDAIALGINGLKDGQNDMHVDFVKEIGDAKLRELEQTDLIKENANRNYDKLKWDIKGINDQINCFEFKTQQAFCDTNQNITNGTQAVLLDNERKHNATMLEFERTNRHMDDIACNQKTEALEKENRMLRHALEQHEDVRASEIGTKKAIREMLGDLLEDSIGNNFITSTRRRGNSNDFDSFNINGSGTQTATNTSSQSSFNGVQAN